MDANPDEEHLWRQDESLLPLRNRLNAKPEGIQLVSFDFFDTLICRLCAEPSDLFVEVGRQLARRGLLAIPLSPTEFCAARIAADQRARLAAARRGQYPEVRLTDIYRELRRILNDVAAAQKVEFEAERSVCYLNPAMASLVRHARALGCQTCIISDTYFSNAELVQLMRDNHLSTSLFDHIFISNECARAKWSGDLYHEVLHRLNLHPSEVLHIGDNLHADVACARQIGIEAVHYYRTRPAVEAVFKGERHFLAAQPTAAGSLNSLRVMTARQAESEGDAFRDGAMTFGPLLSRYADWCVERFRSAGIRKVLALMREGELLGEMVQQAAQAAHVDLQVVPCYVSRLSTARAAMPSATPESALELVEGCGSMTRQAILQILGLEAEADGFTTPEARHKLFESADAIAQEIRALFNNPGFRQRVEAKRSESHKLAFDYLASLVGTEPWFGMIDLGWSGSIQRNISRILRQGGREVYTAGCYLACTKRSGRLALDGDVAHAYLASEWSRSTILAEIAITACCGSTDGYRREPSGAVVPVLGPCEISAPEREIKLRLRQGVMSFQSHWLSLRWAKNRVPLSEDLLQDLDHGSAPILYRLLDYPAKPEAERLGVLRHDENYFGQNLSAPLCNEESARRLRRDGIFELYRSAQCYWPQGVVARNFPRVISALQNGWAEPLALGRLGAWRLGSGDDCGMTDEELFSLSHMLRALAADQVILCGALTPAVAEAFRWMDNRVERLPGSFLAVGPVAETLRDRVRPAGAAGVTAGTVSGSGFLDQCLHFPGETANGDLLTAIRDELLPRERIALVLTSEVSEQAARLLLNGLAPFLGSHGMVLISSARFDPQNREDTPLLKKLETRLNEIATELGYAFLQGIPALLPHLCNWLVLRRAPEIRPWNHQWMPRIADLALPEIPADLKDGNNPPGAADTSATAGRSSAPELAPAGGSL